MFPTPKIFGKRRCKKFSLQSDNGNLNVLVFPALKALGKINPRKGKGYCGHFKVLRKSTTDNGNVTLLDALKHCEK